MAPFLDANVTTNYVNDPSRLLIKVCGDVPDILFTDFNKKNKLLNKNFGTYIFNQ